jgi:hypothetical protein
MSSHDYRRALQVAVDAAAEATLTLLAACAAGGGPGGSSGHCPADEVAERAIRKRLENGVPEYGAGSAMPASWPRPHGRMLG